MEWPLLDGGDRRRQRDRAALAAAGKKFELEGAVREAGERAASVALELLRLREVERTQSEELEWLDRLRALVGAGVQAGTRARTEAVRVGLERDAVASALDLTREQSNERRRELGILLGLSAMAPPLRESAAESEEAPGPAESLAVLAAIARAPEVNRAQVAAQVGRLELKDAESKKALHLDLALDAGLWGSDLTSVVPADLKATNPRAGFSDRLRRDLGASASLELRLPVRDPTLPGALGARRAALRAADVRLETARAEQGRIVTDLMARWRGASRRLLTAKDGTQRSEDNLIRARSLYAGGTATLLELLDARSVREDARERLAQNRFELRLARLQVELRQ